MEVCSSGGDGVDGGWAMEADDGWATERRLERWSDGGGRRRRCEGYAKEVRVAMENFSDEKGEQQPLLETSAPQPRGGGLRTLPFIAGNTIFFSLTLFFLNSPDQFIDMYAFKIWGSVGLRPVKAKSRTLKNEGVKMERYFGWYYAITLVSGLVAMTCLVYIQENMGWEIGFGVLLLLMLCAAVLIFLGSPFYVKQKPKGSLITGLIQVIVASYRKRSLVLSSGNGGIAYHQEGTMLRLPSETLRFLNKACIIQDPHQDLNSDGKAADPWSLCTVDQVEELKAILNVIPIWVTGVIMSINISQGSFDTLQATTVDRHIIGSSFQIPVGSLGIFSFVSVIIWLVLYERAIIPISSRIMGKPIRFSTKTRMGCGIFVSFLSVVVAAVVETVRRSLANKEGYSEEPEGIIKMSVLWLVPHLMLVGFAEAMNAVAQNEFYVSEFPQSMASIASNLLGLGSAAGSVAASFLMSAINDMTEGGESGSWISSNINKGHYDYYNWILAGLSMANMLLFLFCSRAYGHCREENDLNTVVEVEAAS
nr:protein NRT1/ PTR FAMILY 1.2-like isoform X1 [Ipomoea trifida]